MNNNYTTDEYKNSSVMIEKGGNEYLASLLNAEFPARLPDPSDLTASVKKQLTSQSTIGAGNSGDLMLWYPVHQVAPMIVVLGKDPVSGRFNPIRTLDFDLDLSDNYDAARVVSAKLQVISNTFTGAAFSVSGDIKGICYSSLPPIANPEPGSTAVTSTSLPSFARDPSCVLNQTPVSVGAVAVGLPDDRSQFLPTDSSKSLVNTTINASIFTRGIFDVSKVVSCVSAPNNVAGVNGWFPLGIAFAPGAQAFIFNGSGCQYNGGSFMVPNASGRIKVKAHATLANTLPVAVGNFNIIATISYADPVTYVETLVSINISAVAIQTTSALSRYDFSCEVDMNSLNANPAVNFFWIRDIGIQYTNSSAGIVVFSPAEVANGVEVQYLSLGEKYYTAPGILMIAEGLAAGQQVGVVAFANLEAVPNAQLARNVSVDIPNINGWDDLLVARHIMSNSNKVGLKMIYPMSEYTKEVEYLMRLSSRQNSVALSAGLLDGLKGFWKNWLSPVIKGALPIVGGALLGAPGAIAGEAVSALIPAYSGGRRRAFGCGLKTGLVLSTLPQKGWGAGSAPWEMDNEKLSQYVCAMIGINQVSLDGLATMLTYDAITRKYNSEMYNTMKTRLIELTEYGTLSLVFVGEVGFVTYIFDGTILEAAKKLEGKVINPNTYLELPRGMCRRLVRDHGSLNTAKGEKGSESYMISEKRTVVARINQDK